MIKAGLVVEGGGMRGVYSSGVLDFFIEKDLFFENNYGVSAGAHPYRHHEHPVHPGRRVRGPGRHHRRPRGQEGARLQRRHARVQEARRGRAAGPGAAGGSEQVP